MVSRVLVTDAETPAALAVVRSLGRAGHRVSVLTSRRHAAAAASRHVNSTWRVPDPARDPNGWRAALLHLVRRGGWDVLLPVSDTSMILVGEDRRELGERVRIGMPSAGTMPVLLDKTAVLDRASALGIPVLSRWIGEAGASASLPAVVKPGTSRALGFDAVHSATARVVEDRRSLAKWIEEFGRLGFGAYVEPWIPGEGRGIFLLRHGGEVLARFAHRRIREASPLGGPSAVCESVPLEEDLLRHAENLARELDVEGPFMAEFRGSGTDFVLLEVNARFWGSLSLAVDAGVDFPNLYLRALTGDPVSGPAEYRVGVTRRNFAFDLRRTMQVLLGRPPEIGIPWPGRASSLSDLLLCRSGGMVRRSDDPAPGRAHALRLLRAAVGRD